MLLDKIPEAVFNTSQLDSNGAIELPDLLGKAEHRTTPAQSAHGSTWKGAPSGQPANSRLLPERRRLGHLGCSLSKIVKGICHQVIALEEKYTRTSLDSHACPDNAKRIRRKADWSPGAAGAA